VLDFPASLGRANFPKTPHRRDCRAMAAPGRAPLAGLIEVDVTEIPLRTKADRVCGRGGRSPKGKMLVANRHRSRKRRARRPPPDRDQGLFRRLAARRPGRYDQNQRQAVPTPAPPTSGSSHVVGAMAAHAVLPRIHRAFSNVKTWALRGYQGLRPPLGFVGINVIW
jgi:hypothetical protein